MAQRDYYQISLKLILRSSDGKVLILRVVDGGSYEGYWDFPGGRINTDEFGADLLEIVKREAQEETDISDIIVQPKPVTYARHLIPGRVTKDGKDIHVFYLLFEGKTNTKDVRISNEHTDAQWVKLEGLPLEEYFTGGNLEGVQRYLGKIS
ncbi:MAG: NUDIX hydrolase [Patescibacteria group bacterium]|jgi:8-oxo-dGTP pyrophosphatase MutT (NUDIX family)